MMDCTFVTAIESGAIELKALLLAKSIRRFAGRYANMPIVFVVPRSGAPLLKETSNKLNDLGVRVVKSRIQSDWSWYNFINKPISLLAAAEFTSTEKMAWLDDDTLVLNEPVDLVESNESFAACACDCNVGADGHGRFTPLWLRFFEELGLKVADVPIVRTHREGLDIFLYFNGGVFSFLRKSQFSARYFESVCRILEARVRSSTDGIYMHEQMCLGLSAVLAECRIRPLGWNYNLGIRDALAWHQTKHPGEQCVILHYHYGLSPNECGATLATLRQLGLEEQADWLDRESPINYQSGGIILRSIRRGWRVRRQLKGRRYFATCSVVGTNDVLLRG